MFGLIGDMTQAAFRVGVMQVDRGRHGLPVHGDDARQCFDGGGGGQLMSRHAFRRADRHLHRMSAENRVQHLCLGLVTNRSARGVGVDVIDHGRIDARVREGLTHGGDRRRVN